MPEWRDESGFYFDTQIRRHIDTDLPGLDLLKSSTSLKVKDEEVHA